MTKLEYCESITPSTTIENIQSGSLRATVKYRTIQYRYEHSPIAISTRGDLPPSVEVEVEPPDTQSSEAQRSRSK
jgi:hypothetical protein